MKRITLLLRYGLACSTLTLTCGVGISYGQDEGGGVPPPIVQAVDEGNYVPVVSAESAEMPPIIQAAGEAGPAQVPPEVHPFDEGFHEIPPIVQSADESIEHSRPWWNRSGSAPRDLLTHPTQFDARHFSLNPQPLRPMRQPPADVIPASGQPFPDAADSQPIASEIPDENLPPIYRASDLPTAKTAPAWRGENSVVVPRAEMMQVPAPPMVESPNFPVITRPAPAVLGATEYSVPGPMQSAAPQVPLRSSPLIVESGNSPSMQYADIPVNTSRSPAILGVVQDAVPVPMQSVAPPIPMPNQSVIVESVDPALQSVDMIQPPLGALDSGFNSRGQCAYCGGAGCDQCSGAAPVMTYESQVVPVEGQVFSQEYDCCGFMSGTQHYCIVDALYYRRAGDVVYGGNFSSINDFDWTMGGRVTLGYRFDVASGAEVSFMGFDPWIGITQQSDAGGGLFGNLSATGGFNPANLSAFDNATYLEQFQRSDLRSVEFSQTYWGWDVVKTSLGVRVVDFEDFYRLSSANLAGEQGYYSLDLENTMIGPQAGLELFYDIGYRLSFSMSSKIALYANRTGGLTTITNDGVVVLNNADEDTSASASVELGLYGHYQILPRVRARFGYDLLGFWEVMTTADNFNPLVAPNTGLVYENDDEAVFHGVFVGVEFFR